MRHLAADRKFDLFEMIELLASPQSRFVIVLSPLTLPTSAHTTEASLGVDQTAQTQVGVRTA